MKNKPFNFCETIIQPGETASLALPLPEMFSCAPMYMPIKIINGKQDGPTLLVMAAMHGNELNGTEIINRLINAPQLKNIKGRLILVPILNVHGFINRTRTLPGGASLNKCFPGSLEGSHASRLADLIVNQVVCHADYCIDLQTGHLNYTNLPHIYIGQSNDQEKTLADSFSAPVVSSIPAEEGSLREVAESKSIPYLTYEAGEAMRFDENSIKVGFKGVMNVMREINMLSAAKTLHKPTPTFLTKDSEWVRSPTSGINHSHIQLGQKVRKNDTLSLIKDPFGSGSDVKMKAPSDGIVVGVNNLPLVHEGSAIYQIAYFEKHNLAASHFEDWEEEPKVVEI